MTNCHPIIRPMAPALALGITLGCSDPPTAAIPTVESAAEAAVAAGAFGVERGLAVARAQNGSASAAAALEDALARALPALEETGATQGLGEGLRQLLDQYQKGASDSGEFDRALSEIQDAINRYQARAGDEFQPDLGVVQLAVDVIAATNTDDGSPRKKDRSGS